VKRLRSELRQLEASHTAHKQYIEDNGLVLEHLANRTEEIAEANDGGCLGSGAPSPDSHPESPTAELLRMMKTHGTAPTTMSVHVAVESEVELSRLAKVIHQTSLAIRATVAKRARLEEWSRANALRTWAPDASALFCTACQEEFTFFNRRHHCRVCGRIFCADCSQMRVKIAKDWREVRCCEQCMDELSALACDMTETEEDNDTATDEPAAATVALPQCLVRGWLAPNIFWLTCS
jgi:hypothetical protein